jgi:hypothetical protein
LVSPSFVLLLNIPVPEAESPTPVQYKSIILGQSPRVRAVDEVGLSYSNYIFTLSYQQYFISLSPYVVYNGNYFSLEELIGLNPSIRQNVD